MSFPSSPDLFSPIPTEPGSLYMRRYDNMDFYIRANVPGTYFAFVRAEGVNRYYELWMSESTDVPGWQYNRGYGWSSASQGTTANYQGIDYRYLYYLDEASSVPSGSIHIFDSLDDALIAFFGNLRYPITYRPTNCTFPNAPAEAAVGDTVTVQVAFTEGYGIVNNSDIYVTCNGVGVPSTYNNGTLTFTMPDPSQ